MYTYTYIYMCVYTYKYMRNPLDVSYPIQIEQVENKIVF